MESVSQSTTHTMLQTLREYFPLYVV